MQWFYLLIGIFLIMILYQYSKLGAALLGLVVAGAMVNATKKGLI